MTHPRSLAVLACISLVSLLTACGPSNGYYDSHGNFIPAETTPKNARNNMDYAHPDHDSYQNSWDYDDHYAAHVHYDRRGYYDRNGDYVVGYSDHNVPENMFPPRGMCRVWFTERSPSDQPAIESCDGIKSRVPAGAYVIYGG